MVRTTTKKTTKVVANTTTNVVANNEVVIAVSLTANNEVEKVKKVIKSKKPLASAKEQEPIVINQIIETNPIATEVVKAKRGRKSKKDLLASLNAVTNVQMQINELNVTTIENNDSTDLAIQTLSDATDVNLVISPSNEEIYDDDDDINTNNTLDQKPSIKKRGRKPKGGKIIQQVVPLNQQKIDRPNVILHLKCSMKDLQSANSSCLIESFNFGSKNELSYEMLNANNIENKPIQNQLINGNATTNANDTDYDYDDEDDLVNKDNNKEIWRKLKQLEHNLHVNNINNKKSACFWCTTDFDNPPVYVPKHFINGTYHVYGCFCSPECGVAHLMNETIDSSTKFERYHLLNNIYSKIYDYKKNIKPAPNPYYMLEKFYGNLSIQEYRSLLRNERLFLIVDKPLTRILPELHEDNDEFILNNKIIPSNNYQLKSRMQKKKPNKGSILNEKFGITNQSAIIVD